MKPDEWSKNRMLNETYGRFIKNSFSWMLDISLFFSYEAFHFKT